MGLALLIFLTVTLGITAGLHLLTEVLFPEASRVRRRVAREVQKLDQGTGRGGAGTEQ